ncbi:hypothetical protein OIE73_36820 [Streptomyces hirsutus]|uniref:Uncharacterized protein n=2 Tax=Streptomyces TaxID=1883 RepID=A0ABZ1GX13_9ACTN|nr:hypothetical protein [Streptomyces hirsutus]WSD10717.1 hypothetical protein OIE73_36820 [Streptomyces hirsutus]
MLNIEQISRVARSARRGGRRPSRKTLPSGGAERPRRHRVRRTAGEDKTHVVHTGGTATDDFAHDLPLLVKHAS